MILGVCSGRDFDTDACWSHARDLEIVAHDKTSYIANRIFNDQEHGAGDQLPAVPGEESVSISDDALRMILVEACEEGAVLRRSTGRSLRGRQGAGGLDRRRGRSSGQARQEEAAAGNAPTKEHRAGA